MKGTGPESGKVGDRLTAELLGLSAISRVGLLCSALPSNCLS
jgi:hypothetical protein